MIDSLTLNHAARVLATITPELRADAALRKYFISARRPGPREKRAISRAVFTYFSWFKWLDEKASAQKQVEEALKLQERYDKNPTSVKAEALAALAVPSWSRNEVDFPVETLRQLQTEPALWLRARPNAADKLATTLGNCETTPLSVDALCYRGQQDLFLTPAFHNGAFEIQDLASQLVGLACAPKAGETWWDACSGEGGKMLHLADLMQNKGLIWASDRSERRLHTLKQRAARAKIFNFRVAHWDGSVKLPTKAKFDGILIDAPCSGLGTWQRNPHARWTTTENDVSELAAIQRNLLENAAGSLKPNGRLVYAVCTLTRSETTAVAEAFTSAHSELEPQPVFGKTPQLTLWPHEYNANGMFIAAWKRRSQ